MEKMLETITIGEWTDFWLNNYARASLKENTLKIYQDARRRLFQEYPDIVSRPLSGLTTLEFEKILLELSSKYAKSTLRHMRILKNQVYKTAKKAGKCVVNPIAEAQVPKGARVKIVTPMTKEEQSAFESQLGILSVPDDFSLRIFLLTGLRLDELRLLRWRDWNKKDNLILVRESKTESGIRCVPLLPEAASMLKILAARTTPDPQEYIFGVGAGRPVCKSHFRHICNKVTKAASIRHVTPHVLRHTFATRMIEAGVDAKSLAMIIGHSDPGFTLKTYVKPDFKYLEKQMRRLLEVRESA